MGNLDVLHELGIEIGESEKLVLIQVHHEQLVGWRQVQLLVRELLVEIADVFAVLLQSPTRKSCDGKNGRARERRRQKREFVI